MIAQRRQRLDHPVVPIPARRNDADLHGGPVDELVDPLPQIGERLQSLGLGQRRPVDWTGDLGERLLEGVGGEAVRVTHRTCQDRCLSCPASVLT